MEGRYLTQHGIICTQTHTYTCSSVSLHYSYIMSSNILIMGIYPGVQ